MAQRIVFAYFLEGWSFEGGNKEDLRRDGDMVFPNEYVSDMDENLFCPTCYTNLTRAPKDRNYSRDGREAYFAHLSRYKEIECELRSSRRLGKWYDSFEQAQQAVEDEDLVIVHEFSREVPEVVMNGNQEEDEPIVENRNGPVVDVPISLHIGETFRLPSKITTVAGLCRTFDRNYYRYFLFPQRPNAILLSDLLHNVANVNDTNETKKLYFGVITRSFSAALDPNNPAPYNIRMTKLVCDANVQHFHLKATEAICAWKHISDDSTGRIVIMYGKVTRSGIGLCIENLEWGEFALLPERYNNLLLG